MAHVTLHRVTTKAFLQSLNSLTAGYMQLGIATLLAASPGKVVSTRELVGFLYGESVNCTPILPEKNVHAAVMKLRRKGVPIMTHWGRGFSYDAR